MKVKYLFSLVKYYKAIEADAVYDSGLTDADWITSGAGTSGMVLEFTREGESPAVVKMDIATDLAVRGVEFDKAYLLEIDGVWQNVNPKYS